MHFSAALFSAMVLFATNQVIGASVEVPRGVGAIQIATSPYYACNCPNNCKHKQGSSCKYYSSSSDKSQVISGMGGL
ncbi:uncharacterized protein P174DRAFT_284701 [Aspergillus novofumigatus IBT 16806]|uniref:Uncharacterized protein n=1 Tax=Aspergillus novofumigatus (strain IBT 16806) TaxID=1392255 RepID=A0A2I1C0G6_ASPN1|nr:uncharacterized protein P174DRAFT_284701 [Aspergillus novofumigatus IBT 16806]PKX91117.1 hypothetical protein P174DRAFT_284701 [Aspergillus novofumigatus IBT 16806]